MVDRLIKLCLEAARQRNIGTARTKLLIRLGKYVRILNGVFMCDGRFPQAATRLRGYSATLLR